MKLQAYLVKAACFAGLAVAAGAVSAPASAAPAPAPFALTGSGSGTNGIDDTDVVGFGGGSFGSNLTLSGGQLTQVDANYTAGSPSVPGYTPTLTTSGSTFTESYTFDLTQASTINFVLNASPSKGVKFTSAAVGSSSWSGSSTAIDLNTATLGQGWHTLVFSGIDTFANGKTVGLTGSAQVSAVPVPGALILFGSGLLGLGGISRRRKIVKAAKVAVAAALPLAALAFASSAQAAPISLTDNVGTITTTVPLHASLTEGASAVKAGTQSKSGVSVGTAIVASFDFALTAADNLAVTLTPPTTSPTLPAGTTYTLYKGNTVVTPTHVFTETSASGTKSLVETFADLSAGTNYVLQIATTFKKNTQVTISGTVSAVPVPGALLLFGSGLAGLGVARRRRRDQQAA